MPVLAMTGDPNARRGSPTTDPVQVPHHGLGEGLLTAANEVHKVDLAAVPLLIFGEELDAIGEDPLGCKGVIDLHPSTDIIERLSKLLHRDALIAEPGECQDLDEIDEGQDRERLSCARSNDRTRLLPPAASEISIASDPVPQGLRRDPGEPGG